MDSNQPQNHGLTLTTISPVKLTVKLLLLMFTKTIYFLRYNTPKLANILAWKNHPSYSVKFDSLDVHIQIIHTLRLLAKYYYLCLWIHLFHSTIDPWNYILSINSEDNSWRVNFNAWNSIRSFWLLLLFESYFQNF